MSVYFPSSVYFASSEKKGLSRTRKFSKTELRTRTRNKKEKPRYARARARRLVFKPPLEERDRERVQRASFLVTHRSRTTRARVFLRAALNFHSRGRKRFRAKAIKNGKPRRRAAATRRRPVQSEQRAVQRATGVGGRRSTEETRVGGGPTRSRAETWRWWW